MGLPFRDNFCIFEQLESLLSLRWKNFGKAGALYLDLVYSVHCVCVGERDEEKERKTYRDRVDFSVTEREKNVFLLPHISAKRTREYGQSGLGKHLFD